MTNYEYITSHITVEVLGKFLHEADCDKCPDKTLCGKCPFLSLRGCIEWLEQEVNHGIPEEKTEKNRLEE